MKLNIKMLTIAAVLSLHYSTQSFGSSEHHLNMSAHEIGVRDDLKLKMLKTLGDVFEVGVSFPESFLYKAREENQEENSDELLEEKCTAVLEYIASKYKNFNGSEASGDDIVTVIRDLFEDLLKDLDQFEKHELFFSMCASLIPEGCVTEDMSDEDCKLLICNLFSQEDSYKIARLIDDIDKESEMICSIAKLESEEKRSEAIALYIPANRQKGAISELNQRIALNKLVESLDQLRQKVGSLLNHQD